MIGIKRTLIVLVLTTRIALKKIHCAAGAPNPSLFVIIGAAGSDHLQTEPMEVGIQRYSINREVREEQMKKKFHH